MGRDSRWKEPRNKRNLAPAFVHFVCFVVLKNLFNEALGATLTACDRSARMPFFGTISGMKNKTNPHYPE